MNNIFKEGMAIKNKIDSYFNYDIISDIRMTKEPIFHVMTKEPIFHVNVIIFTINYRDYNGMKYFKDIIIHIHPKTTVDEIIEECISCIKIKYNIEPKEVSEKEILEEIERLKDKINKYFIEKRSKHE